MNTGSADWFEISIGFSNKFMESYCTFILWIEMKHKLIFYEKFPLDQFVQCFIVTKYKPEMTIDVQVLNESIGIEFDIYHERKLKNKDRH